MRERERERERERLTLTWPACPNVESDVEIATTPEFDPEEEVNSETDPVVELSAEAIETCPEDVDNDVAEEIVTDPEDSPAVKVKSPPVRSPLPL